MDQFGTTLVFSTSNVSKTKYFADFSSNKLQTRFDETFHWTADVSLSLSPSLSLPRSLSFCFLFFCFCLSLNFLYNFFLFSLSPSFRIQFILLEEFFPLSSSFFRKYFSKSQVHIFFSSFDSTLWRKWLELLWSKQILVAWSETGSKNMSWMTLWISCRRVERGLLCGEIRKLTDNQEILFFGSGFILHHDRLISIFYSICDF